MKKYLLAIYSLSILTTFGQGFPASITNWATPIGGYWNGSLVNYGYNLLSGSASAYNNCENWSLVDMDGDGKMDLVVPSEYQSSNNGAKQYGAGTSPYWKVFLNTGNGFSASSINWATPIGGYWNASLVNYGYNNVSGSASAFNNCQNWSLVDMDGDHKPDLVVPSEYQSANNGAKQYGAGSSPYWKVYLNTGSGFAGSYTSWATPIGGYWNGSLVNFGYNTLSGFASAYDNCQNWSFADINGDGKSDLIVPSEYQSSNNGAKQYGAGSSPYWKVFLNTGSGFAGSYTSWATPIGGYWNGSLVNFGYNNISGFASAYDNCQNWSFADMDGDGKSDLVVPSEYQSANNGAKQYGAGSSPYWKVFLNNGSGFAGSYTSWSTPIGGYWNGSLVNFGYNNISGFASAYDNCQNWSFMDINGDNKSDLVVPSEYQSSNSGAKQYGAGSSPYWKIYMNNGSSFSSTNINWATPIGGYWNGSLVNFGYNLTSGSASAFNNCQNWSTTDMNGDNIPDLVVPSEYQSANNGTKQYGAGSSPYWKVYLNNGITGINENETEANTVGVFPNPFTERLTINIGKNEVSKISVYNAVGEIVYTSGSTNELSHVELKEISAGVYFVHVKTNSGTTVTKVVKN